MAYISRGPMSRLLSSQTNTIAMLTKSFRATQAPYRSMISSTRLYHQSASLQDKPSAPSPSSPPQQNKSRASSFWRRRERKETRNRISTLALDPNATTEAEAQEAEYQKQQSGSEDGKGNGKTRGRLVSRDQRMILLFTVVLSIPIIGRDAMEFIVPGLLGTIIYVGGKVKGGIQWVRRIGSGEEI